MSKSRTSLRISTRLGVERQYSVHSLASDLNIAFVVENNKCVVASYISVVLSFGCSLGI